MRPENEIWERYGPLFCFEESRVFPPDREEKDFYRAVMKDHPGTCVELGAGDGRLTRHLLGDSLTVALEPSAAMLASWPETEGVPSIPRVRALAQDPPFAAGSMDLVLFPYNGIHCVLGRQRRRILLAAVSELLDTGGVFVLEACPGFEYRQDEHRRERYDFAEGGNTLKLVESVAVDHLRRTVVFDMEYAGTVVPAGEAEIRLELALIGTDELLEDIGRSGMRVLGLWGDYDLSPWDSSSSPRLLVMAGRKER